MDAGQPQLDPLNNQILLQFNQRIEAGDIKST